LHDDLLTDDAVWQVGLSWRCDTQLNSNSGTIDHAALFFAPLNVLKEIPVA
jgi:hypothetical protein